VNKVLNFVVDMVESYWWIILPVMFIGMAFVIAKYDLHVRRMATVTTPTGVYENCQIWYIDRSGISLTTSDGRSIHLQGTSAIEWKD
jgi:hypothetical protein